MQATTTTNIGLVNTVDELGELNAKIAELKARAETLKGYLKANADEGEVLGTKYKARISRTKDGERTDFRALAQLLSAYVSEEIWNREYKVCQTPVKGSTRISLYDL